jgi:hypothetical protein
LSTETIEKGFAASSASDALSGRKSDSANEKAGAELGYSLVPVA